jgi:hypothetical protein
MATPPDRAIGPLDIDKLLDLLNASEASSDGEPVGEAIEQPRLSDVRPIVRLQNLAAELGSLSFPVTAEAQPNPESRLDVGIPFIPESGEATPEVGEAMPETSEQGRPLPKQDFPEQDSRAVLDELENRFAAHVVRGMAKLKRQQ